MLEWIVGPEESGSKLIVFLTSRLGSRYSSRFLKRAIEHNRCQINQRAERFASTIVGKGDKVALNLEGLSASASMPPLQFDPCRLLYEDSSLLIYNKPAGISCDDKGIEALLKTRSPTIQLIHRLDRETTGVLLCAKTPRVFEQMVQQFKAFNVEKSYQAIVDGAPSKNKGIIENYLGKKSHYEGQAIWGEVGEAKGVYACTHWIKKQEGEQAALLACYPKTGRTHQIRVHLASIGHPILGDFHYCKRFNCFYQPDRYLLHADAIRFIHPTTGLPIYAQAPLPSDFLLALKRLFKT